MTASNSPRILFVEDNPEVRLLLEHALQEDYDLVLASDAEAALRAPSLGDFDLFLLDIKLGDGKSGTELLRIFRDLEPTREVPAVALTTYGMKGDREALLEEGFDEHVSKPFTKAEVTATIDRVLSTSKK